MNPPKHPREATLLATIFLLNAIEFLQAGMIAFGAGPIMGEIGASPEEFTIVTAVYAVVAIAAISKQRWLIERMGWRRFVQASVAVFIIGAAICATSTSFPQFLAGRAVMGMGGAAFMTSARVMINLMPPSPRRFLGIKVFASALAIGNAAAPWLASIAVAHDSWPAIFVMLALLAATAALLATIALPTDLTPVEQRSQAHPLVLLTMLGGAFLSLYALQRASYDFYADAMPMLLAIVVGTGALLFFAGHQYDHERPLLVVKRLMQPRYLAGLALFTFCYMVLGANNYMLPVLMQRALGFPWEVIGKVQASGLIAALPTFWIMASILPKSPSPKKFYVAGFGALMLCGLLLVRLNSEAGLWTDVLPAIAGYGAFIILVMATTAIQTFADLQRDEVAFWHGQQIKNMLSQFGVALGVAGAALSLQWRTSEHTAVLSQRFSTDDALFGQLAGKLGEQFAASHGAQAAQVAVATLAQQLTQQAALLSSLDYFGFLAVIALTGALVMSVQRVMK
jgi:MFS family permease